MKDSYEPNKRQRPEGWNLSKEVSKLQRRFRIVEEYLPFLVAFNLITMIAVIIILVILLVRL